MNKDNLYIIYIRRLLINIKYNIYNHKMFLVNLTILLSIITYIIKNKEDGYDYIRRNIKNGFIKSFSNQNTSKYSICGKKIGKRNNLLYETRIDFKSIENVKVDNFNQIKQSLNINHKNFIEKILFSYTLTNLKHMIDHESNMKYFDYDEVYHIIQNIIDTSFIELVNNFLSIKRFNHIVGIEYSKHYNDNCVSSIYIQHKHIIYRISDHWGDVGSSHWGLENDGELKSFIGYTLLNEIKSNKIDKLKSELGYYKTFIDNIEYDGDNLNIVLSRKNGKNDLLFNRLIDLFQNKKQKIKVMRSLGFHNHTVILLKHVKTIDGKMFSLTLVLKNNIIEKRYNYYKSDEKYKLFLVSLIKLLNKK